MRQLNLPAFQYRIKKEEGKQFIFDEIRKKFLVLTPEEWVRQHFVHFLIHTKGYAKGLIRLEGGLTYNTLQKRTDILVFDNQGLPKLIVECKAPEVKITQKVFEQVAIYNQQVKAEIIVVTNGLDHYCCSVDHGNQQYDFLKDVPMANSVGGSAL